MSDVCVFRVRETRYGPVNPELLKRFGGQCRVVARGLDRVKDGRRRKSGTVWLEFADGYQVVTQWPFKRKAQDHDWLRWADEFALGRGMPAGAVALCWAGIEARREVEWVE